MILNILMHTQTQTGVEIQSTERVLRLEYSKIGFATLREFTKGQSCQMLSSRESEYYAAVTTTAEALHLPRLAGILGNAQ